MPRDIPVRYIRDKYFYTCGDFADRPRSGIFRGMRLAQIREAKGLTQEELADLANTTQATISRVEKGSLGVTLEKLKAICDAMNVSLGELFLDERNAREQRLVEIFRTLPRERQDGWLDVAGGILEDREARSP